MCNAPQFGHVANVGAFTTSWVRRLACLVWLCLLLGCAILIYDLTIYDLTIYLTFYLIGIRFGTKVGMEEKIHLRVATTGLVTVRDRNIDTYYFIREPGEV